MLVTSTHPAGATRFLLPITGLFVMTLVISNIIAVKLVTIFGLVLPAAVILFPVTYIVGDILTEVYGYARARQVIWIGFACNLIGVLAIALAGAIPAAAFWTTPFFETPEQAGTAWQAILGFAPRLLIASLIAYLFGEFLNSMVLARLKVRTGGRLLWLRTISSTIVGQGADSAIFISIAFLGILPPGALLSSILSQWLFKVAFEAIATPVTYRVVAFLKRTEGIDADDSDTSMNPFSLRSTVDEKV